MLCLLNNMHMHGTVNKIVIFFYCSNGLLLNIFYSQLNFQIIEETFSYGVRNFKDILARELCAETIFYLNYDNSTHLAAFSPIYFPNPFTFQTTNLLADIGGQLGLWIGISALTCGEVLELIFQYLVLAYTKIKNRRQNRVVEIGQTIG